MLKDSFETPEAILTKHGTHMTMNILKEEWEEM